MHSAIFLTLVWMQQEDGHGKMDCQLWLVDFELATAFWVDPKLFENKKQEVQVGLCCFLGTRWKVQTQYQGYKHCVKMQVACSSTYQRCQQLKPGRLKVQTDAHSEYQGHYYYYYYFFILFFIILQL